MAEPGTQPPIASDPKLFGEQRHSARLPLNHLPPIDVQLTPVHCGGRTYPARMRNLSRSGCGLELSIEAIEVMITSQAYRMSFTLPGGGSPYELVAIVEWKLAQPDSHRMMIGVSWHLTSQNPTDCVTQSRLSRFISDEMRRVRNIELATVRA